jgi:hypothetical protein
MTEQVKKPIWKKWWFYAIWLILIIAAQSQKDGGEPASSNNTSAPKTEKSAAPPPAPAKTAGIGDTVKTSYFDVTVNSLSFSKVAGTNEFSRVNAGDGNHFAILNITIKNTDTEGRSLLAGEMRADYNGKQLKFDDAQVILEDGFLSFETLNPLTKITGNVVFKLPEELQTGLSYLPPRSDLLIRLN